MLSFFLSYLLIYKYTILFFVVSFASFGIPIPATALIMAAGAFAEQGYFDMQSIFICGMFASVLGDVSGYLFSLRYGREILLRVGFGKILKSPKFSAMETIFLSHSKSAIFFSRFLATSLGPTVNILAGISKTPYGKFFLFDILGEALYITLFAGLGYMFWNQWENISDISQNIMTIVVLVIVLVSLIAVLWRARMSKKVRV